MKYTLWRRVVEVRAHPRFNGVTTYYDEILECGHLGNAVNVERYAATRRRCPACEREVK